MSKDYLAGRRPSPHFDRSVERGGVEKNRGVKGTGNFLDAQTTIHNIVDERSALLGKVADTIAAYATAKNKEGAYEVNAVVNEINSMLSKGFSAEERASILMFAVAKIVVNL